MAQNHDKRPEPVDLVLRVTTCWEKQRLEYRLHSPSGAVEGLSPEPHHSGRLGDAAAFRARLDRELERLREGFGAGNVAMGPTDVQATLKDIGHWLYQQLFPRSLQEVYRDFRERVRTLLVVSDEPWIPWEMVKPYPDDDFFCMQFEMGRWYPETPQDPVVRKGVQKLLCLTAGDLEGETPLEKAEEEADVLRAFMDHPGVDGIVLHDPTAETVRERLGEDFDLFHFSGHGLAREEASDGGGESVGITLADRPLLDRELLGAAAEPLRRRRPMAFLNSCESGRLRWGLTGLGGWAQSWIDACDGSAFLAPFLPVDDTAAWKLADVFYRELREDRTVGDALRTARRKLRDSPDDDSPNDDVAWLAYSLHAYPNLRLVRGEDVLETVSIEAPPHKSPLKLPVRTWDPDVSPPGALLRAEFGVVRFHFRQSEVEDLDAWCRSEKRIGIRLYTGAGGMGKTRLAREICWRMRAEGWQAGLVDTQLGPVETWQILKKIGGPRLLLVDYAENQRPLIVELMRQILDDEGDAPIRVLLLARAALDWWEQLKTEGDGVGDLLQGPATRWHTIQPLALSHEDRKTSYGIALEAFAGKLGKELPQEDPGDLEAEHYKRALLLHMRAMAMIDGVLLKPEDGEDGVLDYVLHRERRFWRKHADDRQLAPEAATGIGRAMAAITLGGGVDDEGKAILAMRGLNFFKDEKEGVLRTVAQLLRDTYPGEHRWIDPVMPDLLGEHLVMREMEKGSTELLNLVLGPASS